MIDIYNSYIEQLNSIIASSDNQQTKSKAFSESLRNENPLREYLKKSRSNSPLNSLKLFADERGLSVPDTSQQLGAHPDFCHLKESQDSEFHEILSAFIDIKGSTNLFKRYDASTVFMITNVIQQAAIHTCLIFGGYVQRLHGDGLFVYFGGKRQHCQAVVMQSLTAMSLFTYLVNTQIRQFFLSRSIDPIFTRIGVDFGKSEDVLWILAGIGQISEVTTCSLHTSLACKMQANAESNGIVVGDNVVTLAGAKEFFTPVAKRKGESDRYIFQIPEKGFRYTQFDFDWKKYLQQLEYISTGFNRQLSVKRKPSLLEIANSKEKVLPIATQSTPYSPKK